MRHFFGAFLLGMATLTVMPTEKVLAGTLTGQAPIVIGHRGASGYRPEHTLAAYELAIQMGADYIEPDLVATKDGVLVARHENALAILNADGTLNLTDTSTDVYERLQFADRKTTKVIDGRSITGWFTEDFTLEELKTLRAIERIPGIRPQNTQYDRQFEIPTLQEVIDLAKAQSAALGRTIGIYPETKHPTYFDSIGLSMEEILVSVLNANGYVDETAPVYIQSFEVSNLKDLNQLTNVSLVQLINPSGRPYDFVVNADSRLYRDLITPLGLAEIATYANGIGANKNLIIPRDSQGNLLSPTTLVDDAHAAGLIVHAWTFRDEDVFLPTNLQGNPQEEYKRFYQTGIDGLFSDNPDTAFAVRSTLVPEPGTIFGLGFMPLLGWLFRRRK
ncbi:Glycerophosphoryl diester phosphodiesterase [Trichormus variabilis ATCC 29413]|uniref:glycerophosphodiester phosphodiesterase n=2 Tax=Anabaena variabilis TaxID=264691 RepID=Q3M6N6_TRIV2|nr:MULTISPECIES: glycerophosphodiester phosphodiesterase family protein [Nostocaceae]ABA23350.1 Glycerophosphoryl diester phosphodiesterase [Trichormus variabilis ATCC 29413]MBC1214305.1 PEP-CTERM sorting domain-containing protein [Trichormus variabilis ARAD]MBC1257491.1 PEP-CTERM sorting domain-containing protein [Trichormus variabilis V5]MBC1269474.1 PEP-CTERM sorting domain-containing protein [Trichormus variabilis FSR]MBC1305097.1 PEP-CTERM sorting domain-containing protein [Trichormus var